MDVVLIRPPAGYSTGKKPNIKRGLYLLPQGLIYLGEALNRRGHTTTIIDAEESRLQLADIVKIIGRISPQVVGLAATTPSWPFVEAIAKKIRENFPETKIIMGGPHAMFQYQTILEQQLADAVVIGEGEQSLVEYVCCIEKNRAPSTVRGIALAENGSIVYTGPSPLIDIDAWGIPAYHLLNIEQYKKVGGVSISAMRGCPYTCAFCLVPKIHDTNPLQSHFEYEPRTKSAQTIFDEMYYLNAEYGVREFSFIDPTCTYYPDRIDELCELLIRERLDIRWCCQTRVDYVSHDMLKRMARAGCVGILFGVESESEDVLDRIDKRITKQDVVDTFSMCKDVGISPTPSLIMGLPGDSAKNAQKSIDFAKELNDKFELNNYLQFNTFMPSPGSFVQDDLEKYDITINHQLGYSFWVLVPVTSTLHLSYDTHLELWHRTWELFFPEYYDLYLEIEDCAFSGADPLLDMFTEVT
jgi:anaerobic magnesium-protoporphyrin IX monomethyl ester cyclase